MSIAVTEIETGSIRVRGRSLGGFYTSFHVPEYSALFDVGTALRSGASAKNLFLSHAHADHLGSLPALLGMRGLTGITTPLRVFCPEEIAHSIQPTLDAFSVMHRWPMTVDIVPMTPGQEFEVSKGLFVRAFRTLHTVPSLGYLLFRRVNKLRPEFRDLDGNEIQRRRRAGDDLFTTLERHELAYATDTLPEVLERNPQLFKVAHLILECTFFDERKSVKAARAGCHIHLDQLLPYMDRFENESVILMHFSQLYSPTDVRELFKARCPDTQLGRFQLFVPDDVNWWD